jgi:hypothetical protein
MADGVVAGFFVEAVPDYAASAATGRPIHRDIERVRIAMRRGAKVVQAVRPDHIAPFLAEYEAFRAQQARAATDTPVEDWPVVGPAEIEALRALGLITVEAVAQVGDAELAALGAAGAPLSMPRRARSCSAA